MKHFIKPIITLILLTFSSYLFSAEYPEFDKFYYACYDNMNKTAENYNVLYKSAMAEAEAVKDSFQKNIRIAWVNFVMSNVSFNLEDLVKTEEYCDLAVEFAEAAKNEKETEESLLIYVNCIGQNCQVKPFSYLMANGVNVAPTSKKIIKMNPKNGRAIFLRDSQNIYAPAPFNNFRKGFQNMDDLLNDSNVEMSDQVRFDVYCAAAFALINLNKKNEARSYLEQAGKLFPNNKSLKKLESQL